MPADTWFPFESPIELPAGVDLADALAIVKIGFDPCPLPIVVTTADLARPGPTITYVNPAFCRTTGFAPADLVGGTPRVMQGPRTDRGVLAALKAELAGGRCFTAQTINYKKDGTPYVVRWSIAPVRHRGAVVRFVSYQQWFPLPPAGPAAFTPDEAAGLGKLVVEATTVGVAVTDESRRVVWVNPAFCRLAGRPAEALLGEDVLHVRPAGAAPATADDYDRFLAGMPLAAADWAIPAAGGPRTADVAASRLAFPTGRRYAVWTATDVTDRTHAEAALHDREARLRHLGDNIPAGGIYQYRRDADGGGRYTYVSAWLERATGVPAADLLAGRGTLFDHVHPDDKPRADRAKVDSWATGRQLDVVVRAVTPAGERVWQFRAAPRRLPDGGGLFDGVLLDVTDRARLEEQFRQAQKMEAVGELAGGVAHDFNNLLTVILGNLELLDLPPASPGRAHLTNARVAADRAADLTQNLLGFARRRPLHVAPIDAAALLAETAGILRRVVDPRIVIDVRAAAAPARPRADAGAIQQAVLNLCLNARDAMPAGGRLTLSADPVVVPDPPAGHGPDARPGRFVVVRVADTGTGMDAATLARVFEPFFTTKSAGRGTGLGLAMVDGTVKQHGGWVEVHSRVGAGTRFDLYLPDSDPASAAPASAAPQPDAPPAAAGLGVLVVDDDTSVRAVAAAILSRSGFAVAAAGSADEALAWAAANPGRAAVILLDQNMPGRPTAAAVPLFRAACPGVRILIASGRPPDAALAAAVDGYVAKPYTFASLSAAVKGEPRA